MKAALSQYINQRIRITDEQGLIDTMSQNSARAIYDALYDFEFAKSGYFRGRDLYERYAQLPSLFGRIIYVALGQTKEARAATIIFTTLLVIGAFYQSDLNNHLANKTLYPKPPHARYVAASIQVCTKIDLMIREEHS